MKQKGLSAEILCLIFINAFNMMIAVFWEFYEYV